MAGKASIKNVKVTVKTVTLDAILKKLKSFEKRTRHIHFDIAKTVHEALSHEGFSSQPAAWSKDFNETVHGLLPGMTPLTLSNMYRYFPDRSVWDEMGLERVYKAAVDKYADEKPKPPRVQKSHARQDGDTPVNIETAPTESIAAPLDAEYTTPNTIAYTPESHVQRFDADGRPLDVLDRPNEGGIKFAGKTLAAWEEKERIIRELTEENAALKQQVARLNAKLVEVMLHNG